MGMDPLGRSRQIHNQPTENVAAKKDQTPAPQQQINETSSRDTRINDNLMFGSLMRQQVEAKPLLFNSSPAASLNNPAAAPPIDEQKVADALKTIKENLSENILDWDVSHNDLKGIENKLKELNPGELNRVFDQMSPDELKKYTSELEGSLGGYSADEKKALFDHFAKNLSGANLSKLASAMDLGGESSNLRPGLGDEPLVNILARSVAENAQPETKAEFVKHLAANADKHQNAGAAAAEVLASMKDNPVLLEQTLSQLSDAELQSIVDGAARKTEVSSRGGTVTNYDPEPLTNLLDAVSTLKGDQAAAQKARLFDASANKINEIRENATRFGLHYGAHAENAIRSSLTKVIDSDTEGVVRNLEQSNKGEGLRNYVKSMLSTGDKADQDVVGKQIARLLSGNDLSGDQIARFEQTIPGTSGEPYYQNAKSLGLYAGAIHAAAKGITSDRGAQANMVKNIFGTASGLVGVSNPVGGAFAGGLSNQLVDEVVKKMDSDTYTIRNALIDLTFPRGANNRPYTGPAKTDYESSFAATAARNDN